MSEYIYDPSILLDVLLGKLQLKNDFALARRLEVAPATVSYIRRNRRNITATMLIRMHEVSGISVRELRDLMGDRRTKYRLAEVAWTDGERALRLGRSPAVTGQIGQQEGGGMTPQQASDVLRATAQHAITRAEYLYGIGHAPLAVEVIKEALIVNEAANTKPEVARWMSLTDSQNRG